MAIKPNLTDFDTLKNSVTTLFPANLDKLAVTFQQQQVEIESLKRTIGSERFFFVVDLVGFEIQNMPLALLVLP